MTSKDRTNKTIYGLLLLTLLLSFIIRIPFLHVPLERDEGGYAAVAQAILRGDVVYRDVVDNKPPLLYVIYAAGFLIFGQSDFSLRLFTALYSMFTIIAVFYLSGFLFGNKAALISALLYGIFSSGPTVHGTIAQGESFFVLPLTLAMLFFFKALQSDDRKWILLCGGMIGLATLIKTTTLPTATLIIVTLFLKRNPFKNLKDSILDLISIMAGPILLAGALVIFFAYYDAFFDFIHWNIIYNMGNTRTLSHMWPRILGRGMQVSSEHLLLWLLSASALTALTFRKRDLESLSLGMWVVTSALGIAMTGNFWAHYFVQILPPLSVLAGYGILIVYKKEQFHWPVIGITGLLTLSFAWSLYKPILNDYKYYLIYSPEEISRNMYETNVFNDAKKVGEYIKARTDPTDFFFQWGWEPQLYFYTMRRNASKHLYYHTVSREPNAVDGIGKMIHNLLSKRTKYIVIQKGRDMWPGYREVAELVNSYYTFEKEIGGMMIYRLTGT